MLRTSPTKRGFRAGFTVGRGVNVTLAFIFFVLIVLALVVVGSLAHLHNRLINHPDHSNSSHICILFASEENGYFNYGESHSCEAVIYGFAIMAGIFVSLLVVTIGRVVVAADIWCTAIVEGVVMAVLVLFSFALGLVITSGLSKTCDTILDINKEENHCDRNVPNDSGIKYYYDVNSAQASAWICFFLMLVVTVLYGIKSFIYFRRLRMPLSPDMQPVLHQGSLEESQTKPI